MGKRHLPGSTRSRRVLWCGALALYSALVLPRMLSPGMFLDGVVYASLARNMAAGYGSLWRPSYSATVYPIFYEHPPLGFWLQAWAYRLCGDTAAVEAFWGCGLGALILLGLAGVWRGLAPPDTCRPGAWFPAMLLLLTPMTSWIVANNMLETPLTLCAIMAVWCCLLGRQQPRPLVAWGYGIGAGLWLVGGLLIKGPVALFPLVTPGLFWLYNHPGKRRALTLGVVVLSTCLALMTLLCIVEPAAWDFVTHYTRQQLLASLAGRREVSGTRWTVLLSLSREIVVPLLAGGVLTVLSRRALLRRLPSAQVRLLLGALGLAAAASLPLLLSVKQRRWYIFPSLPFYALAVAALWQPAALTVERYLDDHPIWRRRVLAAAALLGGLALGAMVLERHTLRRDVALHQDFSPPAVTLPARAVLSVYPANLAANWTLVAHLQRHFKASVTSELGQPYLVTTRTTVLPDAVRAHYVPIPMPQASTYRLYRHRTASTEREGH